MKTKQKNYTLNSLLFKTALSYEENLETLINEVQLSPQDSIIVAPEVCLTAYDYKNFDAMVEFAHVANEAIKKVSFGKIIILTIVEKRGSEIFNFAKIFFNGEVVYERAKAKLFRFGDEHKYMSEGSVNDFRVVEVDGIKIALFICFELRFKELWQLSEGADVIAVPSYWGVLRTQNFKSLTNSLAIINQCYVVASDSEDEECTKMSGIISPMGDESRNSGAISLKLPFEPSEIKKMRKYMDVGIE